MNSKKWVIVIILTLFIAILAIIGVFAYQYDRNNENDRQETPSQTEYNTVYYNGEAYVYNQNLKNILFLGIDNNAEIIDQSMPGTGGQADCIILLSVDKEHKTVKVLQISRDSMTDVDIYDANGNYYTTIEAQLATQYAYGNSATNSCWAMKKTVSELLYELPIAGCVAVDIAAVSLINDLVGGVTITISEDYTAIDPAFAKGETIRLNGEQAEKYVRYRDTAMVGSNNLRMQRQIQYIPALFETFKDKFGDKEEEIEQLYPMVSPYIVTDLMVEEMTEMLQYSWDTENVIFLEGEVVSGDEFEEFHVDEKELQKKVVEMFYKLK